MKCFGCGVEKDMSQLETYPYDGEYDAITQEFPIPPLQVVECEGKEDRSDFRAAVMCHECWHRLGNNTQGIDMWISQGCWESINPVVPFEKLPKPVLDGRVMWKAESYDVKE